MIRVVQVKEFALSRYRRPFALVVAAVVLMAACSSSPTSTAAEVDSSVAVAGTTSTFVADVWADNWFSLSVNGVVVGEDSVPITTERSFNQETIEFEATYPLTIAVEAKDFKETDSGIEYIGEDNQQMGDGGLILQVTDTSADAIVAVTSREWKTLVIHQAPLNKDCEKASDPDTACESLILDAPSDWSQPRFDDSGWVAATEWSSSDVRPKGGYGEVSWSASAQLIWGTDLETDNTVLARTTVGAPTN